MASDEMEAGAAPAEPGLTEDRAALEAGKRNLAEDQIPAAIVELRRAVGLNEGLLEAWYRLAECYIKFEDWDNAADALAKCGDFDLRGTYEYVRKVAQAAGVSPEELVKEMPQDFSPILGEARKVEEEAARRAREAQELARLEEMKKKEAEAAKESRDPTEPLPANMSPFLTNTAVPAVLSAVSFVVWGFGCFVAGRVAGGIVRLSLQAVALYLYLKETGVSTAAITFLRERLGDGVATFCSTQFPEAYAGQVSAKIKGAYFLSNTFAPGELSFWSSVDEYVWPFLFGFYCLFCLAVAGNSAITSWYYNSKTFLSGFVSELRNQDVWVNFGDNHYVEAGDRYRIYKRTRYLQTVKAEATVTTVEPDKCVVEVRLGTDPETKKPYEIQVGDVVRR